MSLSHLRIKLLIAGGIIGASLLSATFTGCQTTSTNPQAQAAGPYGQYGRGPSGQPTAALGGAPQSPYGGPATGPQIGGQANNQQAFMAETQRIGAQQNLSAQGVVAMSRSGLSDQQIAMAIQQRGTNLRTTPGVPQYLTQQGVNPTVLFMGAQSTGASPYPGQSPMGQPATMAMAQSSPGGMPMTGTMPGVNGMPMSGAPMGGGMPAAGGMPASGSMPMAGGMPMASASQPAMGTFPTAQAEPGAVQGAGYETPAWSQGFEGANSVGGGTPAQAWRPMSR